jgi:hypothetical protein
MPTTPIVGITAMGLPLVVHVFLHGLSALLKFTRGKTTCWGLIHIRAYLPLLMEFSKNSNFS